MIKIAVAFVIAASLSSCQKSDEAKNAAKQLTPIESPKQVKIDQMFTVEGITRGASVYQEHCAECHGPQAQGHPSWSDQDIGTFVVAPPLDGTNEIWKKTKQQLVEVINNGVIKDAKPVMPGWKDRLSDQQVEDAIMWFQALWPSERFDTWFKANKGIIAASKSDL